MEPSGGLAGFLLETEFSRRNAVKPLNAVMLAGLIAALWLFFGTSLGRRPRAASRTDFDTRATAISGPSGRHEPWDAVDEASDESFPASDPPARY